MPYGVPPNPFSGLKKGNKIRPPGAQVDMTFVGYALLTTTFEAQLYAERTGDVLIDIGAEKHRSGLCCRETPDSRCATIPPGGPGGPRIYAAFEKEQPAS